MTWRRLALLLLCFVINGSHAKVRNTDTHSSFATKVLVGISQALDWGWVMFVGENISRPPKKVKVALVGFGRTGSTSLCAALTTLGLTPMHDDAVTEVADILHAMMTETMSMDEVNEAFGRRGFDAPMISTKKYVEWAAVAPDVKVILTVRDPAKWAKSWLKITPAAQLPVSRPFSFLQYMHDVQLYNEAFFYEIPTQGQPHLYEDIPTLERGFEAWVKFVKATVPPERLLVYSVKEGWEPLCNFLDKQIPPESFPHINDGDTVTVIIYAMLFLTWVWPIVAVAPIVCAYYCLARYCRRTSKPKLL